MIFFYDSQRKDNHTGLKRQVSNSWVTIFKYILNVLYLYNYSQPEHMTFHNVHIQTTDTAIFVTTKIPTPS